MTITLTTPVIMRMGIGGYLNILWFDKDDTLSQRIDKAIISTVVTESIYRHATWKFTPFKHAKWNPLRRTRAVLRGAGKIARVAGPFMLGAAAGTVALNVGARAGERLGLVSKSQERHAIEFTEQMEYGLTLGTSGKSPLGFKEEWGNVFEYIVKPTFSILPWDPVLGWQLPKEKKPIIYL